MKKIIFAMTVMISVIFVGAIYAQTATVKTTGTPVYQVSKLLGTAVTNIQGEDLGKINDMIFLPGENVAFAVLAYGFSGKLIPVPVSALKIGADGRTATIDISRQKLEAAPSFTMENWPDLTNRQWTENTYKFYGISPAWR